MIPNKSIFGEIPENPKVSYEFIKRAKERLT